MVKQSPAGGVPPVSSAQALPVRPAVYDLDALADDLPNSPALPLEQLPADHPDIQQWVQGGRDKLVISADGEACGEVPQAPRASELDHTFPVPGTFVGPREDWVDPPRLDSANPDRKHNTGA